MQQLAPRLQRQLRRGGASRAQARAEATGEQHADPLCRRLLDQLLHRQPLSHRTPTQEELRIRHSLQRKVQLGRCVAPPAQRVGVDGRGKQVRRQPWKPVMPAVPPAADILRCSLCAQQAWAHSNASGKHPLRRPFLRHPLALMPAHLAVCWPARLPALLAYLPAPLRARLPAYPIPFALLHPPELAQRSHHVVHAALVQLLLEVARVESAPSNDGGGQPDIGLRRGRRGRGKGSICSLPRACRAHPALANPCCRGQPAAASFSGPILHPPAASTAPQGALGRRGTQRASSAAG